MSIYYYGTKRLLRQNAIKIQAKKIKLQNLQFNYVVLIKKKKTVEISSFIVDELPTFSSYCYAYNSRFMVMNSISIVVKQVKCALYRTIFDRQWLLQAYWRT